MSVGKLEPFDLHKDDWNLYIDRLEQYFIVNDVKPAMRIATLITVVGSDAYELMVNLCTPEKPSAKTYDDLVDIMRRHLQPKPSVLAERFKFRQRVQRSHESIAEYAAALKKMTKYCGFCSKTLSENLRDQFVCGLISEHTRQRLFTEDNITFDLAFKLAMTIEAAETDAALVEDRSRRRDDVITGTQSSVHNSLVTSSKNFRRQNYRLKEIRSDRNINMREPDVGGGASTTSGAINGGRSGRKHYFMDSKKGGLAQVCKVCGGNHSDNMCKFNLYVCRVCNKQGHLKKMCPNIRGAVTFHNIQKDNYLSIESEDSNSEEVNNFSINSFIKNFGPYTINICVDKCILCMEIDTGSAISCISYDCYQQFLSNNKIIKSDLVLKYYTGEIVKPVGKITPLVTYRNKCKRLDLFIIKSATTNLLGRQWLNELEIELPTTNCNKIDSTSFNFEEFSSRYCEVFSDGLGRFTGGTVGFRLRPDARPVFMRARPLAYALREPVERALDQLVRDGVITPVNTSDWATPIVPVMKKDGTIRICGDFKITLNKCLEVDRFPLPRVEDLLAKLHGGLKFTKLDLSQAYAQLELDDSKKYTVINTHKGLFIYNRLIYGLASSPGIFQRKLEQLFADMPRVGVFLDDVIITGVNNQSHLDTLHEVFKRLKNYGLKIKKEKCTFFADSVTYLGFVIDKDGVHTCPKKVEAIKNVKVPTNVSELRSFLGLVMYYAKFVPNISMILAPLYQLLQKDVKFQWDTQCDAAFNKVKQVLVSSKVLAHYSLNLPLILTTDASSYGVGAVISHLTAQGERPISYASRVLNSAEKSYSQIEKEALAIIYGLRKFHQYLYGRKFTLRTDHKPLVSIFGDKSGIPVMAASRIQRWAVILAGYDYDVEYVRSNNNAADALSRLPVGKEKRQVGEKTYVNFIQDFLPVTRKTVVEHINRDDILKKVILYIQSGWPKSCDDQNLTPYFIRRNELYLDAGCVIWGYRLVIPKTLTPLLLKEMHVGHLGVVKMKSIARSWLWWPGVDADIERTCKECETCTMENAAPVRTPPKPWPYIAEPWSRLHVDFLGPLCGKTFLVLIDSTSKWLEIFYMQTTTAAAVIRVLRETFARFGLPKEIVSDNGPPFSSREYSNFMDNNGIKVTFTPVYHPSSNGAAEGAVKLCKRAIKKSLRDGCDVEAALQSYLLAYRNVEQSTTGLSPAMMLQRRRIRSRLDLLHGERMIEDRVQQVQRKQEQRVTGITRKFNPGDRVWARNYGEGKKWLKGKVDKCLGSRNYLVVRDDGPPIKRHVDQVKKRFLDLPTSIVTQSKDSVVLSDHSVPEAQTRQQSSGEKSIDIPPSCLIRPETTVEVPTPTRSQRVRKPIKRYGFEFD